MRDTCLRTDLLLTPPQGQGCGLDHCQAVDLVARLLHGAVAAVVAAGAGVQELHAVAALDALRPQRQGAKRTPERKRRRPAPRARLLLAQAREKLALIGRHWCNRSAPPSPRCSPTSRAVRREVGGVVRDEVRARARTPQRPTEPRRAETRRQEWEVCMTHSSSTGLRVGGDGVNVRSRRHPTRFREGSRWVACRRPVAGAYRLSCMCLSSQNGIYGLRPHGRNRHNPNPAQAPHVSCLQFGIDHCTLWYESNCNLYLPHIRTKSGRRKAHAPLRRAHIRVTTTTCTALP